MPELPEVETIKRTLAGKITGAKIKDVEILTAKFIRNVPVADFLERVRDKRIVDINRRGKRLILDLGKDFLVIHLMMAGRLLYHAAGDPRAKHTHLVFWLDNGAELRYVDLRHFGGLFLHGKEDDTPWTSLGPEPLEDEFSMDYFQRVLGSRRGKIKSCLLDQKLVAGLGNIYADECLFQAGIHPAREASSLGGTEVERLHRAIREVLSDAIAHRGTTFATYVDGEGNKGEYASMLKVYRRVGQPCANCRTPISKVRLAGRTAHFCGMCQKAGEGSAAHRAD